MKSSAFKYHKVKTIDQVFDLLEDYGEGARILAGGQSLIPAMNVRLATPSALIDINDIEGLDNIEIDGDILRFGALVRHAQAEESDLVAAHAPLIQMAISHVAHPGIRNRGSIGGSVVHADPASEYPACMVTLNAKFKLISRRGTRIVSAQDFFLGTYEVDIKSDELLLEIELPVANARESFEFAELSRRTGDYAMAGLSSRAIKNNNFLSDVRLVFFAVSDRPVLAKDTGSLLEGKVIDSELLSLAQDKLNEEIDYYSDIHNSIEMKAHLSRVLLERVIRKFLPEASI